MIRREKTNYIIQSVAHSLDVLEQFFGEADELGVTELSKRLKLHKNNVEHKCSKQGSLLKDDSIYWPYFLILSNMKISTCCCYLYNLCE